MNLLTAIRKSLIERLETITAANGYRTNAGRDVRHGWFNEVIEAGDVEYPMIVVQKAKAFDPESGPGAIKVFCGFNVIAAADAGLDDYEEVLEDLELDLLRCLIPSAGRPHEWAPRGVTGVTIGASESFPPGNGLAAASVVLPIHVHAIIKQA